MKKIMLLAIGVTVLCGAAKYLKINSFEDLTDMLSTQFKGLKKTIA